MYRLGNFVYYTLMIDLTKIKQNLTTNCSSRGVKTPEIIILHCPVGTFEGTVATFKNPRTQVSAHYVVDRDGSILQMVALADAAWHAMYYPNMIGIGIEMVDEYMYSGYLSRGCMQDPNWFTKPELDATAELVAALMQKFNIPINKVMGHNDPWLRQFGNTHVDPGPYFPWVNFRQLVQALLDVPKRSGLSQTTTTPEHEIPTVKLDIPLSMKPRKKRGKPLRKVTRKKN